jgi:hypothetical protein
MMAKFTTEELIAASMAYTATTPGATDKLKEFVNWLSKELQAQDIPLYIALSAFTVMIEGARMMGDLAAEKREGEDVVQ